MALPFHSSLPTGWGMARAGAAILNPEKKATCCGRQSPQLLRGKKKENKMKNFSYLRHCWLGSSIALNPK